MGKLSLVLGGGAARGAAHLGVFQALEEMELRPELVVGVSIGAWVGAAFCAFPFQEAMERLEGTLRRIRSELGEENGLPLFFRVRRLFSLSRKRAVLEGDLGLAGLRFSDLHTPFYVTTVALPECKRVVIGGRDESSLLIDPVLASSA
ncbi:MAG: patatin-like phospholipase family protein, partial [candidate division NC10 bacterium]|nr:patatin-like phospholipase family protein [candidate division NC10 bacterium]